MAVETRNKHPSSPFNFIYPRELSRIAHSDNFIILDMPITPFHLGPAAAVKALMPGHFSLTVFALTQLPIDLEPLYYMAMNEHPLHRFMHTFAGATLAAILAVIVGRPFCEAALRWWNAHLDTRLARWLSTGSEIPLAAAVSGAVIGAYSHLALDAIMHTDVRPLAPFSQANPLHGLISITMLYWACAIAGLLGLLAAAVYAMIRQAEGRVR